MSNASKHTQGPWRVGRNGSYIRSESGMRVATADDDGCGDDEMNANARLIAAAPEMFEALEQCLNFIENTESELGIDLSSGFAARAAIAKARGEG